MWRSLAPSKDEVGVVEANGKFPAMRPWMAASRDGGGPHPDVAVYAVRVVCRNWFKPCRIVVSHAEVDQPHTGIVPRSIAAMAAAWSGGLAWIAVYGPGLLLAAAVVLAPRRSWSIARSLRDRVLAAIVPAAHRPAVVLALRERRWVRALSEATPDNDDDAAAPQLRLLGRKVEPAEAEALQQMRAVYAQRRTALAARAVRGSAPRVWDVADTSVEAVLGYVARARDAELRAPVLAVGLEPLGEAAAGMAAALAEDEYSQYVRHTANGLLPARDLAAARALGAFAGKCFAEGVSFPLRYAADVYRELVARPDRGRAALSELDGGIGAFVSSFWRVADSGTGLAEVVRLMSAEAVATLVLSPAVVDRRSVVSALQWRRGRDDGEAQRWLSELLVSLDEATMALVAVAVFGREVLMSGKPGGRAVVALGGRLAMVRRGVVVVPHAAANQAEFNLLVVSALGLDGLRLACCVCQYEARESAGLRCEAGHFVCALCFDQSVRVQVAPECLGQFRAAGARIVCPLFTGERGGCTASPFTIEEVTGWGGEASRAFLAAREAVREGAMTERLEQEFEDRLAQRMERALAQDAESQEVERAALHVQNQILTLRCPSCTTAFFDYDGCAALRCGACQATFCALCLTACDSSNATHRHVRTCDLNPNPGSYFVQAAQFEAVHRVRKRDLLAAYLDTLPYHVAQRVRHERRTDFADLLA